MTIIERLFLIMIVRAAAAWAHGTNWSKAYLLKERNRLSVQLHINDENIARISQVKDRKSSIADLLENDRPFVISEIWNGIDIRVEGETPGGMADGGCRFTDNEQHSASGSFHTHGRTVLFTRTWTIPDTAVFVTVDFHLFSADSIRMK